MCNVDVWGALDIANLDCTKVTSLLSWYHLNVNGGKEDWTVQNRVTSTPLLTTCDIGWLLKEISKSVCERTPAKRTGRPALLNNTIIHTSEGTRNTPSWPSAMEKCCSTSTHTPHTHTVVLHTSHTHGCHYMHRCVHMLTLDTSTMCCAYSVTLAM